MRPFLRVLVLATLPALGNLSGVLLAELVLVSRRTRSLALHAAAGVVLAIVGVALPGLLLGAWIKIYDLIPERVFSCVVLGMLTANAIVLLVTSLPE